MHLWMLKLAYNPPHLQPVEGARVLIRGHAAVKVLIRQDDVDALVQALIGDGGADLWGGVGKRWEQVFEQMCSCLGEQKGVDAEGGEGSDCGRAVHTDVERGR